MESTSTAPDSQDALWTARVQFLNSTTKPVKLLELGDGLKGKFARIEFEDEVSRPVYLPTMEDAWSSLFDSLTYEERWKIRNHQNPFAPETQPDGSVKELRFLSFQSTTFTKRRRYIRSNHFDVPAQTSHAGYMTGVAAAKEYLQALSIHGFDNAHLISIISDMEIRLGTASKDPSRRWAASGFLDQLGEMLVFAAKHCDHQKYFQQKIQMLETSHEKNLVFCEKRLQEQRVEFVERMRVAKAAKRQAVEQVAVAA